MPSSKTVERVLNVIMTIGSTRYGRTRAQLFRRIPDYRDATSEEARDKLFERDKAEILRLGFPLETVEDPFETGAVSYRMARAGDGGIALAPDAEQKTLLLLASNAFRDARHAGLLARTHAKVIAYGPDLPPPDAAVAREVRADSTYAVGPLLEAVHHRDRVAFDYRAARTGEVTRRSVDPWELAVHRGHWYLLGFDTGRGAERLFRVSRILSLPQRSPAPDRTERPAGTGIAATLDRFTGADREAAVTVSAEPYRGLELRRRAGAGVTEREFTVTAPVPEVVEAVLHDPTRLVVTAPEPVAAQVRAALIAVRDRHRAPVDGDPATAGADRPAARPRSLRTTADALARLVAIAAYATERPGVELEEMARTFDTTPARLIEEFETLFVCGDMGDVFQDLIDVRWDSGRVYVENADAIARPLTFTADEVFVLLTGLAILRTTAAGETAHRIDELAASLRTALGEDPTIPAPVPEDSTVPADSTAPADSTTPADSTAPEGSAGPGDSTAPGGSAGPGDSTDPVSTAVVGALGGGAVEIVYSAPSGSTTRVIEPERLDVEGPATYVTAWCHRARGERRFRLDRIATARPVAAPPRDRAGDEVATGEHAEQRAGTRPRRDRTTCWVQLDADVFWIAEAFGADRIRDLAPGVVHARIATAFPDRLVDAVVAARGRAELLTPAPLRGRVAETADAGLVAAAP